MSATGAKLLSPPAAVGAAAAAAGVPEVVMKGTTLRCRRTCTYTAAVRVVDVAADVDAAVCVLSEMSVSVGVSLPVLPSETGILVTEDGRCARRMHGPVGRPLGLNLSLPAYRSGHTEQYER